MLGAVGGMVFATALMSCIQHVFAPLESLEIEEMERSLQTLWRHLGCITLGNSGCHCWMLLCGGSDPVVQRPEVGFAMADRSGMVSANKVK